MDPSVSQQIDQSELFILVQEKESYLSLDPSNSLVMSFSRRKIIKRFRRRCSAGCSMMISVSNKALKMSQSWVNIIMFQTSQHSLIDWDLVSRSQMSFLRISLHFSMRNCTNSTLIWSRKPWTSTNRSELNTSHWLWSHHNLKLPCQLCKPLFSHQPWRSFLHRAWTCMISMSNSQVKRSSWHS